MRLIDAEELMKWCNSHYDYEVYTIGYFTKIIESAPTVDSEQKKKGEGSKNGIADQ